MLPVVILRVGRTVGGLVHSDGGPPEDEWFFYCPRRSMTLLMTGTWSGLRGSGSKSLAITVRTFVPEHRAIRFADAITGELSKGLSSTVSVFDPAHAVS